MPFRRHANSRSDWALGKWWNYLIRLIIPVVLGTLFFWQLFDDITGEGFLRTQQGEWILPNCVGLGILACVPVIAIIFSLIKGRTDVAEQQRPEGNLDVKGRFPGTMAFVAAVIIAGLLVALFTVTMPQSQANTVIWFSLVAGIAAMLLSNYVLDRYHTSETQASWMARWAGIIATMDVSASVAVILIGLAQKTEKATEAAPHIRDKLGGTSYVILIVALLIIIVGLGWSFYRALAAAGGNNSVQQPGQTGDAQG